MEQTTSENIYTKQLKKQVSKFWAMGIEVDLVKCLLYVANLSLRNFMAWSGHIPVGWP